MKKPETADEVIALHRLCQTDPQRYLGIATQWIRENPRDADAYFSRHYAWLKLGQPDRALDDLNNAIAFGPDQTAYLARGKLYRQMGDYENAINDFQDGELMDPYTWDNDAMGPYYQADCYARLGNESSALSYCSKLPDDFWTPGLRGAPAGNKAQIADALRRIAIGERANRL